MFDLLISPSLTEIITEAMNDASDEHIQLSSCINFSSIY